MAVRVGDQRLLPSWTELLSRASQRLREEQKPEQAAAVDAHNAAGRFVRAGQAARRGLAALWPRFLADELDPPTPADQLAGLELAQAVWGLGSRLVVTTNYDRVLELACPTPLPARWRIQSGTGLADLGGRGLRRPTVWHLHGHVDDTTQLVLTPDSYRRLYPTAGSTRSEFQAALEGLRRLMTSHTLLFVGCSLDDRMLLDQLHQVRTVFGGAAGPHFALVRQSGLARARRAAGTAVELVPFERFDELPSLLESLADAAGLRSRTPPARELPGGWKRGRILDAVGRTVRVDGRGGSAVLVAIRPSSREHAETFAASVRRVRGMNPAGVVPVLEGPFPAGPGRPGAIVAWCPGGDLWTARVGRRRGLRSLAAVADTLTELHGAGVVHGGVRPSALQHGPGGILLLQLPGRDAPGAGVERRGRLAELLFAPPDGVVGEAADVFSLAATAAWHLSARLPRGLANAPARVASRVPAPPALRRGLALALEGGSTAVGLGAILRAAAELDGPSWHAAVEEGEEQRRTAVRREQLLRLLSSPIPEVRRAMLDQGGDDPSLRPAVRRLLADPVITVRVAAVRALREDPASWPLLRPLLDDSDSRLRAAAASALGQDPSSRAALAALLHAPDAGTRRAAVQALAPVGDHSALALGLADPTATVRRAALAFVPADASELRIAALRDDDAQVRRLAARGLALHPDAQDALRGLVQHDPSDEVRVAALAGLVPGPPRDASLEEAVVDPSWRVRKAAITADGAARSLADPDWHVREAAVRSVCQGLRGSVPRGADPASVLLTSLADTHAAVRGAAARALAGRGAAVPGLIEGLTDPDARVRRAAAAGLDERCPPAPLLLASSDPDPRVALSAVRCLSRQGAAARGLRTALADPREDVRAEACRHLAGHDDATPLLVARLADPSPAVRSAAVTALAWSTHARPLLRPLLADPRAEVRAEALRILGDDPEADPARAEALGDGSGWVRAAAVASFAGHPAAAEIARRAVDDPDSAVRSRVAELGGGTALRLLADPDPDVRAAAIGCAAAHEATLLLSDESARVRAAALRRLASQGSVAAFALLDDPADGVRAAALGALSGPLDDATARRLLEGPPVVRRALARLLTEGDGSTWLRDALLGDVDPSVVAVALQAIGGALEPDRLHDLMDGSSALVAAAGAGALGRADPRRLARCMARAPERYLPSLLRVAPPSIAAEYLGHPLGEVVAAACEALVDTPDPSPRLALLDDARRAVSDAAIASLGGSLPADQASAACSSADAGRRLLVLEHGAASLSASRLVSLLGDGDLRVQALAVALSGQAPTDRPGSYRVRAAVAALGNPMGSGLAASAMKAS
jgi:HEAT repeat protein